MLKLQLQMWDKSKILSDTNHTVYLSIICLYLMIDASSNKTYSIFNSINKMKVCSKVNCISVVYLKSLLAPAILGQDELRIEAFALNLDKNKWIDWTFFYH